MSRATWIADIETRYPADADNPIVADIGQRLLEQARRECNNWRQAPLDVLERYAQLCRDKEATLARHGERNAERGI